MGDGMSLGMEVVCLSSLWVLHLRGFFPVGCYVEALSSGIFLESLRTVIERVSQWAVFCCFFFSVGSCFELLLTLAIVLELSLWAVFLRD